MTQGIDIVLCYRRRRGLRRGKLKSHWRQNRVGLTRRLQQHLGFSAYTQIHRSSRINPLYLGICLSRSWPVAALFSLVRRLPVPALVAPHGGSDERWDIVEILSYSSPEAARDALTTASGMDALSALRDDAEPFVRNGIAVVAQRLTMTDDTSLRYPRTVTMFLLRPRPGLGREAMLEYWKTDHRSLVESLTAAMGHRIYRQLHVAGEDAGQANLLGAFGARMPVPYSGIAYLAYNSQWSLLWRLFDPRLQIANLRLVKDEVGFIDLGSSWLVFGTEETL